MPSVPASDPTVRSAADVLDPDVRRFVTEVNSAYARIEGFATLSPPDARRAAELVRAPWRAGGPAMLRTREALAPVEGGAMRIRVYDPGPDGSKPALIYSHGGGWTLFSLDTHDRVMREYAARAGIIVVGTEYPLAPEVKYPVALHQIRDLVRWLGVHGVEFGIDARHLALGGDSAGGNLSLAVAVALRDAGEGSRISALLLNYGAVDSDCSAAADAEYGGDGFMLTRPELRQFVANYTRSPADELDPLAYPGQARLEGLPPAFLTIAECDVLAEQNVALFGKLQRAGVPARAVVYRGATHSFLESVSIAALADQALADGSGWLSQVLAGHPPSTGLGVASR
jgi:acetyl esterase